MRAVAGLALALAATTAAAAAQPAGPPRGFEGRGGLRQSYADPSAVIAADLALGRIGRDKGEARALRDAAAPGAVLFAPRAVDAASWLRRRVEPTAPGRWQPHAVWMSCDGDYAISRGVWTRGAASGDYVAVWQRQRKGGWKWLVRDEGPAAAVDEAPEMIAGRVAECAGLARRRPAEPAKKEAPLPDPANAESRDHSLQWSFRLDPACGRRITARAWTGRAYDTIADLERAPPPGGCG